MFPPSFLSSCIKLSVFFSWSLRFVSCYGHGNRWVNAKSQSYWTHFALPLLFSPKHWTIQIWFLNEMQQFSGKILLNMGVKTDTQQFINMKSSDPPRAFSHQTCLLCVFYAAPHQHHGNRLNFSMELPMHLTRKNRIYRLAKWIDGVSSSEPWGGDTGSIEASLSFTIKSTLTRFLQFKFLINKKFKFLSSSFKSPDMDFICCFGFRGPRK